MTSLAFIVPSLVFSYAYILPSFVFSNAYTDPDFILFPASGNVFVTKSLVLILFVVSGIVLVINSLSPIIFTPVTVFSFKNSHALPNTLPTYDLIKKRKKKINIINKLN